MSTPSLLNIPYVIKAGTLYSQIPETGAGDFAVSRTTSPTTNRSTRVNANGFIELVNDNVPRLDYPLGGAVNGCPALLVEPQAQNTCLQSETFQNWTFTLASGSSGNVAISPSNTQTAGLFIPDSGTTGRGVVDCGTLSNATTYTFSCFIKTPTNSLTSIWLYISDGSGALGTNRWGVLVDLTNFTLTDYTAANGSVTSKAVENYGNGWYRIRVTGQVTSGMSGSSVVAVRKLIAGADTNGINGVLVWGAQLETGSVATSYIPTTTAAITRAADVIRKTGITSLIGQSEGTVYFDVEVTDEARNKWFCSLDSASNSFIQMWVSTTRSISVHISNGGSTVMTSLTSSALSVGYHKVAFAYNTATNGCIMYIDGVQNPVATRTVVAPGLPAFNDMSVGTFRTSTSDTLKAHVRAGAVYPNRLSNSELAALTTP